MKKLGLMCCILLLFLTGCSEKTAVEKNQITSPDTMTRLYAKDYVAWPYEKNDSDDVSDYIYTDVCESKFYTLHFLSSLLQAEYHLILEIYDINTGEKTQKELSLLDKIEGNILLMCSFQVIKEDEYVFGVTDFGKESDSYAIHNYLVHTDAEGKVLYQTDINPLLIEYDFLEEGCVIEEHGISDKNGNCFLYDLTKKVFLVTDSTGALIYQENDSGGMKIELNPIKTQEGEYLFLSSLWEGDNKVNRIFTFDRESNTMKTLLDVKDIQINRLCGARGNCIYYQSLDEIIQHNLITDKSMAVFSLSDNNLQNPSTLDVGFTQEGLPMLRVLGAEEDWLVQLTREEIKRKDAIQLAIVFGESHLSYPIDKEMKGAASKISRGNPEYSYTYMENQGDKKDFHKRVMTELSTGAGPEILYVTREDAQMLQEKGLLEDLNEYLTPETLEALLPATLQMAREGEFLYGVPFQFTADTLITAMDTCSKSSWTVEDVCTLIEETEDLQNVNTSYFREMDGCYVLGMLLAQDWRNCPFIDWEKKECDFLQESFYQMLEFSKEYGKDHGVEKEEVIQWLKEGKVLAEHGYYNDFYSYLLKHQELDFDYNEIGFPTNSGNGNYLDSEGVLVVRKGVSDKGAATAFLEQMLSEEVQKKLYFISVRKLDRKTFTDEEGIVHLIEGKGRSLLLPIREGEKTYIEEFQNFLLKCAPAPINDSIIEEIVIMEAYKYTTGNRSLEETVEIIQKRVYLYLEEAKLSNK